MATREELKKEFYYKLNGIKSWEEKEWSKVFDWFYTKLEEERRRGAYRLGRRGILSPHQLLDLHSKEGKS